MANRAQPQQMAQVLEVEAQPEDGSVPLTNSRSELFAQFRALTGCTVKEAYLQAGGKPDANAQKQGTKFGAKPEVKKRIQWLKTQQAQRLQDVNVMSRREILQELYTNMGLGRLLKGGLAASNRALEMIGSEEHDMFVKKSESRSGKIDELDGMKPEQLIEFIKKAMDRIPGVEVDVEALAAAAGIRLGPGNEPGSSGGAGEASQDAEVPEG